MTSEKQTAEKANFPESGKNGQNLLNI